MIWFQNTQAPIVIDSFNSASFNTVGSDCTCVSASGWKNEACIKISIRKIKSCLVFAKFVKVGVLNYKDIVFETFSTLLGARYSYLMKSYKKCMLCKMDSIFLHIRRCRPICSKNIIYIFILKLNSLKNCQLHHLYFIISVSVSS